MRVWLLRALWCTLPLTAGSAATDAISSWDEAPRVVAAIVLWGCWAAGTVAVLAPRPAGLTVLRVIAPAFAVCAAVALIDGAADGLAGWGAVGATLAAAVLASDSEFAMAAVNALSYGDERRFPLRTPPALFLGPLPIVRALVVAGIAAGPLLLADGKLVIGILAVIAAVPVVPLALRALHGLSRRWFVLVPAGVVVVDPLTLADPMLFVRQRVRILRAAKADAPVPEHALDLRLGATAGTMELGFDEPAELLRAARGRHGGTTVHAQGLLVAVVRRAELLAEAAQRRVRVEVTDP
jgi:hypothetical protein